MVAVLDNFFKMTFSALTGLFNGVLIKQALVEKEYLTVNNGEFMAKEVNSFTPMFHFYTS